MDDNQRGFNASRKEKLTQAKTILRELGFGSRQSNDIAGYTLLALANVRPNLEWSEATAPLCGIKGIIDFIKEYYGVAYAPNTRETIRDEAVKYFVAAGLVLANPDQPDRATNSGKFVYQLSNETLELIKSFNTDQWESKLHDYLVKLAHIRQELDRARRVADISITISPTKTIHVSPGGQNPLIKAIIEQFCPRFVKDWIIIYVGDARNEYRDENYMKQLGIVLNPASKMPDVIVYDQQRKWLLLIEAVTSAGPIDGKRRQDLKEVFKNNSAGLVFVTAFKDRKTMRRFLDQISWETEVWIADHPDHIIHFDGERFLGPYPDTQPSHS
ncbi:BsuBI/PstI family type II restriction endonuclease [Chloroflexus sp.]|uniref:BsuBI/PstI family type II restriction endonuclease n=1 Tax=Chloroflexus sp. TaxID=1904827 RepID=UPI00298F1821|nr:BsuBI/PstI family type II restriction endonuclease [Chloroflexus sp.]MDW8403471.1 BsuBI/PstI family type II restriction endonuclease [Chloroflexus sp.]